MVFTGFNVMQKVLNEPPTSKDELVKEFVRQEELRLQLLKAKSSKDLFVFNKYILGVENGGGKVPLNQFHKDICYFVQNQRNRKKLLLIPRGHLKSTLITVGYSVFRLVENINTRILILNATWQMAVDFLTEIKNHLQKNEQLIQTFGNLSDSPTEWSQDRITLKRSDHGIKGPSVWASGIDSNLVGSHPDLIIMDDVVNRDNADSDEMMYKTILRYKDALDLLEPGGQLVVIGTRWNDKDLYDWILNPDNKVLAGFDVMVKPAFEFDGLLSAVFGEGGELAIRNHLWPEKFSTKELSERYFAKGPYEFSAQYLNDPVPDESAIFRRDWFKYVIDDDWRGRYSNCYMTVDPAISLAKEADFTGIVITNIDEFGSVYIRHMERLKVTPSELIDTIFYLAEQFHPMAIGIEMTAFQKTLQYSINDEMRKRRRNLPIREIKPSDRTKTERIKALQPLYANGKIFHNKVTKNLDHLEDELTRFPRGKHDDLIDALSYQLDLIVPPRPRVNIGKQHYLYGNN